MNIGYRIYSNQGTGGEVDFSVPLATVSSLNYVLEPIPFPSDWSFVVHAYDKDTNLEEANSDARVRFIVDNLGIDVTGQPSQVEGLRLVPIQGAGGRVTWSYAPTFGANSPSNFLINLSAGSTSVATASVPYRSNQVGYAFDFQGPFPLGNYSTSVLAVTTGGLNSSAGTATAQLGLSTDAFVMDSLTIQ